MGLSLTVSEINGDFSRKSQILPNPVYLRPSEGVPFGIGYRRWGQESTTYNNGASGPKKRCDDIFSPGAYNV